ncbi:MAG: 2'-5' RNA ligase [Deltaproteobacteria bacterium RIFOXYD12_FULL_57_12]|nr:MAG: 2'-5' RNA ligase [Deltaproteobacteria bacterium RIFOXYD12_FULL_57_12]
MYRLFVAIDLPDDVRAGLADLCFGIPGAKWVPPEQIHLTLRFIGEVDGAIFQDISETLADLRTPGFSLRLKGVGHFPPRKPPRVLWVGVEPQPVLIQLRNKVETALIRLGLLPEGRKFAPHITLARLHNTPLNKIGNFLAGNSLFECPPFPVATFQLYSSVLTPKGAIHTIETVYPLG